MWKLERKNTHSIPLSTSMMALWLHLYNSILVRSVSGVLPVLVKIACRRKDNLWRRKMSGYINMKCKAFGLSDCNLGIHLQYHTKTIER